MRRVLHIDYPAAILRLLENNFQNRGFLWDSTESGIQGFHMALLHNYHLIILSLRETTIDGLRIVKGLKRAGVQTPILILMPARELDLRRSELSRYSNVLACHSKPLDMRQMEKALEFLRDPVGLNPKDKSKLLAILSRIEREVSAEV